MSSPRRIVIVDSSGILHRHYRVASPMNSLTKSGHAVEVAAVYGYINYVANRLYGRNSDIEFDTLIHAMDQGGSDYRRALYPPYKGNREDKEPDLLTQEILLGRALRGLGEHVAQMRGVEADDLAGTLARQFAAQGHMVAVITGDKDLFQLVKDGEITLVRDLKDSPGGRNKHTFYEEKDVLAKMGVTPAQIADYLALVGDTVDNIPGVQGVGEKTAVAWLQEHGSLASLLTKADGLKGKIAQRLVAARDDGTMDLMLKLTQVLDQVEGVSWKDYDQEPVLDVAVSQEIHRLIRLPEAWPLRLADHRLERLETCVRAAPHGNSVTLVYGAPNPPPVHPTAPAAAPTGRPAVAQSGPQPTPTRSNPPVMAASAPAASASAPVAAPAPAPAPAPRVVASSLDSLVRDDPFGDGLADPFDDGSLGAVAPLPAFEKGAPLPVAAEPVAPAVVTEGTAPTVTTAAVKPEPAKPVTGVRRFGGPR
jgi:DNA polymerase-1